jgi:hypothetical protein
VVLTRIALEHLLKTTTLEHLLRTTTLVLPMVA